MAQWCTGERKLYRHRHQIEHASVLPVAMCHLFVFSFSACYVVLWNFWRLLLLLELFCADRPRVHSRKWLEGFYSRSYAASYFCFCLNAQTPEFKSLWKRLDNGEKGSPGRPSGHHLRWTQICDQTKIASWGSLRKTELLPYLLLSYTKTKLFPL